MIYILIGFLLLSLSAAFAKGWLHVGSLKFDENSGDKLNFKNRAISIFLAFSGVWAFASTSYVLVGSHEVGHLKRIYGSNLPSGHIIGINGQKGYQSEIMTPGFHFSPLVTVLNTVEIMPMVTIPTGWYGRIVTRDGTPLGSGQVMADEWSDELDKTDQRPISDKMLDAYYFLTNGGQRGLQTSVLKPGRYALNLYLYEVRIGLDKEKDILYNETGEHTVTSPMTTLITKIPAGNVGVVRSSIQRRNINCVESVATTSKDEDALRVLLVPMGCKGIWNTAITPGDYFFNRDSDEVTLVDTRVQTWEYKGGYTRRHISLSVDQAGNIEQLASTIDERYDPKTMASPAINIKVEGWEIPLEMRILVQTTPENAPIVVAAVGGMRELEDRVLTPTIRSVVRNVIGGALEFDEIDDAGQSKKVLRQVKVLDLINNRVTLENAVTRLMKVEGQKAGVNVLEVRFGEPAIPPELLVARQREQLAGQLAKSYIQEKLAQDQRKDTEQARATAEQQPKLVSAQIDVQKAQLTKQERALLGEAEQAYLTAVAKGQQSQVAVLGQDRVMQLQMYEGALKLLSQHPDIVTGLKLPQVWVSGGAGGVEGAAAIFGHAMSSQKP